MCDCLFRSLFVGADPLLAKLRTVVGVNPAANVETSDTVPGGRAWLVISYTVSLVTDANVANRRPSLIITDGQNTVGRLPSQGTIAASQTVVLTWGHAVGNNGDGTAAQSMGLWKHPLLLPGWVIGTTTASLQATDNYGAPVLWVVEFDYNR